MQAWAALNFAFDLALLWASSRVRALPAQPGRLALGAALGTVYFLLLPPGGSTVATAASLAGSSCLMVAVAYRPSSVRALWTMLATFYGVAFVAAGAGMLAAELAGRPAGPAKGTAGAAAALLLIGLVAVVGFRNAGRLALLQALRVQLELRFGDHQVRLEGLVDTGNRLREPVSSLPVVLARPAALRPVVPEVLQPILADLALGRLDRAGRLAALEPGWGARLRLVPFSSVGTDHGLLAGFRADEAVACVPGRRPCRTGPVVVALAEGAIFSESGCQALVPAECVIPGPAGPDAAAGESRPTRRAAEGGALDAAIHLYGKPGRP